MNAPTTNGQVQAQPKAIQRVDPRQQKVVNLRDYLEVRKRTLADVLPRHMTPERVIKVALMAFSKTPKLQECSIESVAQSVLQASELGLEAGGVLGHAYLVPFKGTCTLIVGYRGLIKLARQSGEVDDIEAHPVYANDKFRLTFGLNPVLEHEPNLEGDPGQLRFVYAIARMTGGGHHLEVMTKSQIDKIRAGSQGRDQSPWRDNYDEMSRKTVIRRLCKYLPLSPEKAENLERALEIDDEPAIDVTAARDAEAAERAESRTDQVLRKAKGSRIEAPPVMDVDFTPTQEEPTASSAPATTASADEPPPGTVLPTGSGGTTVVEAKTESGRTVRVVDQ